MRRILNLAAVIGLCLALGGCGGADVSKGPGYTPIPDKQLFTQIAAISGVTKVALSYRDTFEDGSDYVGDIAIDAGADVAAVLDQSLAILRQGRWQASMTVVAVQDGHQISTDVLGLKSPTNRYLTERYGPQPGDGKPPETTQAPTP